MISESIFADKYELWVQLRLKNMILGPILAKQHFSQKSILGLGTPLKSSGTL